VQTARWGSDRSLVHRHGTSINKVAAKPPSFLRLSVDRALR